MNDTCLVIERYKKGSKLNLGINNLNILPFNTRTYRLSYRNGFSGIVGEISRIIEGLEYSKINVSERVDSLIDEGIIDIDIEYVDDLKNILNSFKPSKVSYTFDSIKMLKYIPLSGSVEVTKASIAENKHNNEMKKEKDVANFILYNLLRYNNDLVETFNKDVKTDVLTRLFHSIYQLGKVQQESRKYKIIKIDLLQEVEEDLKFLLQSEKLFLENFEHMISLYFFVYVMKIANMVDRDTEPQKIFWFYQDEKHCKGRAAANLNWKTYKEGVLYRCYMNILTLDILTNFIDIITIDYDVIISDLEKEGIENIKEFIIELRRLLELESIEINTNQSRDIVGILYNTLENYYSQGKQQGSLSHYVGWFEDLGKKYFFKQRGSYGYTLNLTEDYLLFLVTVIVKDERIKLNSFFEEMEKRGIWCDNNARKAVVSALNKIGLLEKKSDSGDAQYIRTTLERR